MKNMKILTVCLCLTFLPTLFANDSYDYFQLVLTWPPTFCNIASRSGTPCNETIPQVFTLSGFWPSNSKSGRKPWCTGPELNLKSISELTPILAEEWEWPNLKGQGDSFWKNEWKKHGRCSRKQFNEFEYFQHALNLKKKLTILNFLAQSDIHPTPLNRPTVHHFHNKIKSVIRNQIGATPHLWCKGKKLLSTSICVDYPALKFINCPRVLEEVRGRCQQCGHLVAFTINPN